MNLIAEHIQLSQVWPLLLGVFLVALLLSFYGVRYLITYLEKNSLMDRPNTRSMHQGVVPRGGGLMIVALIVFSVLVLALVSDRPLFFASLAACISAWAGLSWCDDKFDLSPGLRFGTQLIIAIATVFLFGWIGRFMGLSLGWLGPVLSVFGLLWMANLNNFMDGMDGLAASQAVIASVTLGSWFLYLGDIELALLCVVICASSYGFLLWNWQPAKIFMGDVGSITLGAIYGTLIIIASNRHHIPVLSLLLIFAVFIADATYTIGNRLRKGEKIWLPHRSHFYQRAGLAGVKHAHVVLVCIILMVLCSLIATLSVLYRDIIVYLVLITLAMLLIAAVWVVNKEKNSIIKEPQ